MQYGRLMLDVVGLALTAQERDILGHPQVGGLILFARNYQCRAQLLDLIAAIREQNDSIVIAVDQEGGRVQRFRDEFVALPPMQALHFSYQQDPQSALQQATELGWLMASEITGMDIDISFAAVLDLHWSHSDIIGTRSFGSSAEQVIDLTKNFIQGMGQAGMRSTGKHFPGHGWVSADSHLQIATDERSLQQIRDADLKPFAALIEAGLDAVMPAHVIYPQVDPNPAGFSNFWLQHVLREELKFDGVIFSDDLNMQGASLSTAGDVENYAVRDAAALSAGCDTVLVCNNPQGALQVLEYLDKVQLQKSDRLVKMRKTPVAIDAERFYRAREIAGQLI
ncbi:MAG: beta-N-acetylhexosaminidase [Pseudomonadales bacterium]|nr:beta-N-acetylhexosaminidase [Pseudomonadales bacterium]